MAKIRVDKQQRNDKDRDCLETCGDKCVDFEDFSLQFHEQGLKSCGGDATFCILIRPFILGSILIGIGVLLYVATGDVREKFIDYTHCKNSSGVPCSDVVSKIQDGNTICKCEQPFNLNETIPAYEGQVFMYYRLTNFYQNDYHYSQSIDYEQLWGWPGPNRTLQENGCSRPYRNEGDNTSLNMLWPCGHVAMSMFQDEIDLYKVTTTGKEKIQLRRRGILSIPKFKQTLFKNPVDWNTPEFIKNFSKPPTWVRSPWELDPSDPENNGVQNEDFINWMRQGTRVNFRKLYRIIDNPDGLPAGNYILKINYSFPAKLQKKQIVLQNDGILGQRNMLAIYTCWVGGGLFCLIGLLYIMLFHM